LLEHADPDAWMREIDLVDALRDGPVPRAEVLAAARESLAPILFPDVPRDPSVPHSQPASARPDIWLPQSIVAQIKALRAPEPSRPLTVALVLRDGTIVQDAELSHHGAVIARIAGDTQFTLDPYAVTAAIENA
jgi:hypothetical protein